MATHYVFIFRGQSNMEGYDPTGGSQMLGSVPTGLPTGCRYFESGTNGTGGTANGNWTPRIGLPPTGGFLSGASPAGAHHGPELQFVKDAVAHGIPEANITVLKATRNGSEIHNLLAPGTPIVDTGLGATAPGVENWRLRACLRAGRPAAGKIKVIDWYYQGEGDAKSFSSNADQAADYGNRLDSLYAEIEALYGVGTISRNIITIHPSIEFATDWLGSATAPYADVIHQHHINKADILINPGNIPAFTSASGFSWAGGAIDQYNTDHLHIMGGPTGYTPLGGYMFQLSIPLL